ncbi:MAG TPA: HEAT repeat domain-containing protein [Herpetosiphonaceae bacterium]
MLIDPNVITDSGASNLNNLIGNQAFQDIAERFRFGAPASAQLANFDQRSDAQLLQTAAEHTSALERERALWEYAHRNQAAALPVLAQHFKIETDASVRWNLLWLMVKSADAAAVVPVLHDALNDPDREVRDWATLFLEELTGEQYPTIYNSLQYHNSGNFDQTLPLQIAGFADVRLPGMGWVQARLSPQWFASILGRVMACTNVESFMTDLVIEKEIVNYHEDGTPHYETFMFRGASYPVSETVTQHIYESNTMRPFYHSGKVKEGVPVMTPVALARAAGTERLRPKNLANIDISAADGEEGARGQRLREGGIVRSVRGRFWGWAYTDLNRYLASGTIEPGTVQLVSTADPVVGKMANTVIYGTFRGKLGDLNGDGTLDVNLIPCHGTLDGELDLNLDGIADSDPRIPQA